MDPFATVKAAVHQTLLESLGPQLYDPNLEQADLDQRVRQTLQVVIDGQQTPLSAADRTRIAQEVSDEIRGHGPLAVSYTHLDVYKRQVHLRARGGCPGHCGCRSPDGLRV